MSGIPIAAQPQPMQSPAPRDWNTTSAATVPATAWVSARS